MCNQIVHLKLVTQKTIFATISLVGAILTLDQVFGTSSTPPPSRSPH